MSASEELLVATSEHCSFCFEALRCHLAGEPSPVPNFPTAECPLFVTWNTCSGSSSSEWRLRGCIGTLASIDLHNGLRDYALQSALYDRRFSPVQFKELPSLKCSVSLLSCYEEAGGWDDWCIGTHGIIISFTDPHNGSSRSATYLPDVCAEQGWSKLECVDSLIKKAGYHGPLSSSLRSSLKLTRYQGSKASITYAEYQEAKEQADTPATVQPVALKVAA